MVKHNMQRWPDGRIIDLLGIEIPIIQAPMAGADSATLARAVSSAGGLGSLACALLSPREVQEGAHALRDGMGKPFNLSFFSHTMAAPDIAAIEKWKRFLRPHYEHWGLDIDAVPSTRRTSRHVSRDGLSHANRVIRAAATSCRSG
jgi:nitronate monooxygenase